MPTLRERAGALKLNATVLMIAMRHPSTPWYAKACGVLTLLYLLAPIDLIPDFIPVIGHLDDLILVPFGIWLTIRLIPDEVWAEAKTEVAKREAAELQKDWRGGLLVVGVWILLALLGAWLLREAFQ